MEDQKPKKQLNPFIRFTTIALQMGLTIWLGSQLGSWMDVKFDNQDEQYHKIVTLVAVFIAMFTVIRQVINLTNKD